MNTGDISFVLISTLLVWLMTPGLALFYTGLSEKMNRLALLNGALILIGLVTILWFVLGYGLAFSGQDGFSGIVHHFCLNDISFTKSTRDLTISDVSFALFQATFAIITVMIFAGALIGRMRTKSLLLFTALWLIVVYSPLAHMVWDNGFIAQLGAIDFAGGTVVHISSGVTALVLALVVGPRKNKAVTQPKDSYVFIGGLLLWLGWFGFNGGSALAANEQAVIAIVNTFLASAAALLGFAFLAYRKNGEVTVTDLFNGALTGLVAITPAAGFVASWAAIVIGLLAAPAIHWGTTTLKDFFKYDEPLDAFGIHGVGGIVGAILTGIFASKHAGSAVGGLIDGNLNLLVSQLEAIVITVLLTATLTYIIAKIARVKPE